MYQAYGVLGRSLKHSLSPLLHNRAFKEAGMHRVYFKWEIEPQDLKAFIKAVRILPVAGVSVTIPYKEEVIPLLDQISPEVQDISAVNTIYWENNSLCGTNTDWQGFLAPIEAMRFDSALVLGAGGACRAVLYGLKRLGVKRIVLTNRNEDKALSLAREFKISTISWLKRHDISADLLVNTTPLGTAGTMQERIPCEKEEFPFKAAYDLVYNPLHTRLLKQAEKAGAQKISGLDMFVHQAMEQFRLWTGQEFDPAWAVHLLSQRIKE